MCGRGQTASGRGWRLGLSSPGDPVLPRRDEAGPDPPPVLRTEDASRPAGFPWSRHSLTPQLQDRFPFRRDRAHHLFPLPPSRPQPAALGTPRAVPRGPPSPRPPHPPDAACARGRSSDSCPLPTPRRAAPAPRAVPEGRSSAPPPASVPVFSAPPSQRLEVGPSPCALRRAMSRGPGPGPEPRLVAQLREDAAMAAGPTAGSAGQGRIGRPAARRRAGVPRGPPPPRRHVTGR